MLTSLWIENFLTIAKVEMDFDTGFTALTGETGAGKSMLMDALLLALGGRGDLDMIRPGAPGCEVTATFHVDADSRMMRWVKQQNFELEAGEWVLTRQLHRTGRSKAYLNGKPCPLQMLKSLGSHLVHVHGQHAHHALLHSSTARGHVDRYAEHQPLLMAVAQAYDVHHQLEKELELMGEMQTVSQRLAFISFQIEELEALKLEAGEMEQISKEHKRLHHVKDYLQWGEGLLTRLSADEGGVEPQLREAQGILRHLPAEEDALVRIRTLLEEAGIQIQEAIAESEAWLGELISDPERLAQIEARMSELHQAARKYRVEIHQLPTLLEDLIQEQTALEAQLNARPALLKALDEAKASYQEAAMGLSEARKRIAPKLAKGISSYIQSLGMAHGCMHIAFEQATNMERHGFDKLAYEVSTNPGMAPALLSKVASGGELSRISLAIELMTAERSSTPTLLFDEVDVGIGGKVASVVGRLMRQLGERAQVFCVTHQPQVAACAHHHIRVEKEVLHQNTFTHAQALVHEARVQEIARMLGGVEVSAQALDNAKSLIEEVSA